MKIGIGIDTGGTYTDAVIYNFDEKQILGSSKALTTKTDLSFGILAALDNLPHTLTEKATVISLSTTLATNACVEDTGGNARLVFFGGDRNIVDSLGGRYGLPPAQEIHLTDCLTDFSGAVQREPDWDTFCDDDKSFRNLDGIGIIEMNALRNNAVIERKAKTLLTEKYGIPVICGHELSGGLNCLQRGAGVLLNARLFSVIREFLTAIRSALDARGIHATVVIVRSDGSLMSEEFSSSHPVETLLCGPAASMIGGARLSGEENGIIVDMGGTTTDLALVRGGLPVMAKDGVGIGKWKTFVSGLYVKTFGLGGDTAIHYRDGELLLEDYRIVPLCVLAQAYPSVMDSLRELETGAVRHTRCLYEHYLLQKDIAQSPRYTHAEKAFCAALKAGPLSCRAAAEAVGLDIYNLNVSRLLKEGIVQLSGLTPTDIMHLRGDFTLYSTEAAQIGAEYVARNLNLTVETLCDRIYDEIKRRLYIHIVKALLENKHPRYQTNGIGSETDQFIRESYEAAKTAGSDPFLTLQFRTDLPLIGVGAPIKVFLDDVARLLGTRAVIPEYFETANALGAILANISAVHTLEIKPGYDADGEVRYQVIGSNCSQSYTELEAAEQFAASQAEQEARAEAIRRGAQGEVHTTYVCRRLESPIGDGSTMFLGTTVTAHATGSMRFTDEAG